MLRIIILLLMLGTVLPGLNAQNKSVSVGLVVDHKLPELNRFTDQIEAEVESLLSSQYQVNFKRFYEGNLVDNPQAVDLLIQKALDDDEVDIIVGIGLVVSTGLAQGAPFEKPVIATTVLDPDLQEIPYEDGTSGIKDFTYVVSPTDFYRDLEVFYNIYPFTKLTLLIDEYLVPQIDQTDPQFDSFMNDRQANFQLISVTGNHQAVLDQIASDADAVYVGPIIGMESSQLNQLIQGINQRKLPSFSFIGRPAVERGVLAGLAPASNFERIARRIALNIERYLDDEKLSKISVEMNYQESLTINMATARTIGFSPGWDFLRDGVLLHETEMSIERNISLQDVIEEALENNWSLAIADKNVEIGQKEVLENRASLLPQLDISGTSSMIDSDRAAASGGQFPERTTTASSSFSQLLYSDGAMANFQVAKMLQKARVEERAATRLDVIQEVTEAYLNLLITKTVERIQKENIRLNRINLQLAEVRQEVGYEGPSDLYRWQSNIALANIDLNNAQANRRNAEINLNRILNRPLDEPFNTIESDILDANLITNDARLNQYVDNPEDLRGFTAFMVNEGLTQLPELRQLDASILAQERLIKLYRRNFYVPDIGLAGSADYLLNKGGAGSGDIQVTPGLEVPNDLTWSLGLSATLPILTGGKRSATLQKGLVELQQLQFQRFDLVNQLEQRIRSNMQNVGASFSNIQLSEEAQEASLKNFNLIQEAYKQGTVSVINLIDAQNAAIQAQLNAANAGYNFIIDLLSVDRAVGKYYSLSTTEERENYFQRLKEFTDATEN